ncbi:phasin family protein [Halomonas koreensis]|uniref:Phasin family protein n=1 Tax=Halomonas koreensis TaxID=245385 RepID=A0ABU1FY33_9GAMM|nr:phasin family protein [Halomonas koreensis]MDR5865597.1 phasin family protein [Halomonas koreensis]
MQPFDTKPYTEQLDALFLGPARAYAGLTVDFAEKLTHAQLEAGRAYAETGLAQLRALVDVKDAEGLRSYMEGQQKVAKELTERLKGDAEKVASLQQDFVQQSQKLTEENVKQATETASKATKSA